MMAPAPEGRALRGGVGVLIAALILLPILWLLWIPFRVLLLFHKIHKNLKTWPLFSLQQAIGFTCSYPRNKVFLRTLGAFRF